MRIEDVLDIDPIERAIWVQYFEQEPPGELGAYYRSAVSISHLFNIQSDKKHRIKDFGTLFPSVFPKQSEGESVLSKFKAGAVHLTETGEALKKRLAEAQQVGSDGQPFVKLTAPEPSGD